MRRIEPGRSARLTRRVWFCLNIRGDAAWTAKAVGSIAYLALIGSAVPFVGLTILLRHITAQAMSFLAMLLPFGALIFGATIYDERITARAVGGAALVATGLLIAQMQRRPSLATR